MNNFVIVVLFCFMRGVFSLQVRFPEESKLLTLDALDNKIKDKAIGEVFYGYNTPPSFPLDSNYYCTIRKLTETQYKRVCTGVIGGVCNSYSKDLQVAAGPNRAMFTYATGDDDDKITEAYWSSHPEKYVWRIQCFNYDVNSKKCPLKDAKLSIFLQDGVLFVPVKEIGDDLFAATKVKFLCEKKMDWNFYNIKDNPCTTTVAP